MRQAQTRPVASGSPHRASLAGFTAIEISAVATVIAILAIILIPIVRGRVEESKMAAVQESMAAIQKIESTVYSDTGFFFRLSDLPLPAMTDPLDVNASNFELGKIPNASWNEPLTANQRSSLRIHWKGPHVTPGGSLTLRQLLVLHANKCRHDGIPGVPASAGGPILVLQIDESHYSSASRSGLDIYRHPVDPWGQPYLFFGPEPVGDIGVVNAIENETHFGVAAVYSLGPDGLPGANGADIPENYFRESGVLGTGDDIERTF